MPMIPLRFTILCVLWASSACDRSADTSASDAGTPPGTTEAATDEGPNEEQVHAFCHCMLEHCHDDFHEAWGESDLEATLNCRDEASALPRKGEPTLEGDFVECRMGHCEAAAQQGDEEPCAGALGESPCD